MLGDIIPLKLVEGYVTAWTKKGNDVGMKHNIEQ
jgi:hypothetical protein